MLLYIFFFLWEKIQNQELSGVYLTNSGKNQEQLKIRKNQESLDRLQVLQVLNRTETDMSRIRLLYRWVSSLPLLSRCTAVTFKTYLMFSLYRILFYIVYNLG